MCCPPWQEGPELGICCPHFCREDDIGDPVHYPERERRFLGCIRLPLSAVYQLQVVEGTFKLEVRGWSWWRTGVEAEGGMSGVGL